MSYERPTLLLSTNIVVKFPKGQYAGIYPVYSAQFRSSSMYHCRPSITVVFCPKSPINHFALSGHYFLHSTCFVSCFRAKLKFVPDRFAAPTRSLDSRCRRPQLNRLRADARNSAVLHPYWCFHIRFVSDHCESEIDHGCLRSHSV